MTEAEREMVALRLMRIAKTACDYEAGRIVAERGGEKLDPAIKAALLHELAALVSKHMPHKGQVS